jgi:hypothetical protein
MFDRRFSHIQLDLAQAAPPHFWVRRLPASVLTVSIRWISHSPLIFLNVNFNSWM